MLEVPKKLLNKWNRRLRQEGLPARLKSTEEIPLVPLSNREVLLMLAPEIKKLSMEEFLALQDKIQKDIITDLETKKEAGMREENILKRLHFLVEYGHHLSMLDEKDSDKHYKKPELSDEELKLIDELDWVTGGADKPEPVDEYVERMEAVLKPGTPKKLH